ncbi:MerR family transcriptional regulator [Aeromicrobium sp. CTD01-1L150]|uniref:MerR family transcriptional regulator n=1 Tax=Aeromicrobium sp. CTD01-1L150 TaxID=3341830 RepID=UPI0035BF3714
MELTIAEVAERTGLTVHTLRYYERDGLLLEPVTRDASGRRRYGADDVRWIEMIACLRSTGMGISGVRRYAELVRRGEGSESERLALLRAHREEVLAQLAVMTQHLGSIEYKIDLYEQTLDTQGLTSSALKGVGS